MFPILLILNIYLQKDLGIKENLLSEARGSGVFVEGQPAAGSGLGNILTQLGDLSRYFWLGWRLVESGRQAVPCRTDPRDPRLWLRWA